MFPRTNSRLRFTPVRPPWRRLRYVPATVNKRQPYGLDQEEVLRRGLEADFAVDGTPDLDRCEKVDCVVRDRSDPSLPPVGIQFTLREHDIRKKHEAMAAVRASRVVERFLYLIAAAPLEPNAFPVVGALIRRTARDPGARMVSAVLDRDASGAYRLRDVEGLQLRHYRQPSPTNTEGGRV